MRDSKTRNRFSFDSIMIDGEPEENDYYEGYLNDTDSQYVGGFDWNTEMCVNGYFNDVDQFKDKFAGVLAPDQDFDKLMNVVKETMMQFIEDEREALITSFIGNMSEAELTYMKLRYGSGDRNYVLQQNNKVFELTDEAGEYNTDVSDYVDTNKIDEAMLAGLSSVFGDEREYCAECVCRDTCLRKNCIYDK